MGPGYRNQTGANRSHEDRQGMHTDERFTGRGGEGYWEDRTERSGYNSGYNQGGTGYGGQGGPQRSANPFRGNTNAGAQNNAREYNQGRDQGGDQGRGYPDMYGPDDNYGSYGARQNGRYGQGGNYQQADFEHGVGYGQGTGGRWANAPQASMQDSPQRRMGGMQGNYGQGVPGGYDRQQPVGGHRGKGPHGYIRSDDRIREHICEALHEDDHIDASHIEVVVKNGEVMLTGTVEDRRQKRLAEDLVEHMPGVKDVQNQLRVGGNQNTSSAVGKNETETTDKKHRA
ncbi:MAG: BON domain-containing protein [Myxococcota bacterium]|nr:BON domain-containing protein [Myxococcota bacterium]